MRKHASPGVPSLASPSSPAPGTPYEPLKCGNEFDGSTEGRADTLSGRILWKRRTATNSRYQARPVEATTHRTADGEALLRPETWQGTYP